VRRGFDKIEEPAGLDWLQEHLDYCTSEPWILDIDTTRGAYSGSSTMALLTVASAPSHACLADLAQGTVCKILGQEEVRPQSLPLGLGIEPDMTCDHRVGAAFDHLELIVLICAPYRRCRARRVQEPANPLPFPAIRVHVFTNF
jgi:hypothetical protein